MIIWFIAMMVCTIMLNLLPVHFVIWGFAWWCKVVIISFISYKFGNLVQSLLE